MNDIRILYRDWNGTLWGLPYELRPGQAPKHLDDANRRDGWVYLGSTHVNREGDAVGWFGNMTADRMAEVKTFLVQHKDCIPMNTYEWARLEG